MNVFDNWHIDRLFLSLAVRKKSSNFTRTLMCQKRKLPIYVHIFLKLHQLKLLGCLLCFRRNTENSQCRNLEIPSRNQVGSKNKPSISSSSCHSNDIWVMKESCKCSLMLSVFIIGLIPSAMWWPFANRKILYADVIFKLLLWVPATKYELF